MNDQDKPTYTKAEVPDEVYGPAIAIEGQHDSVIAVSQFADNPEELRDRILAFLQEDKGSE